MLLPSPTGCAPGIKYDAVATNNAGTAGACVTCGNNYYCKGSTTSLAIAGNCIASGSYSLADCKNMAQCAHNMVTTTNVAQSVKECGEHVYSACTAPNVCTVSAGH